MKTPQSQSQTRLNPFRIALALVRTLLQDLPIRQKIEGFIRARDFSSLASVGNVEDREYSGSEIWSVLALRQVSSLFKKNDAFADNDRCTSAAQRNFERGERICRITNRRLDWFGTRLDRLEPELKHQLDRMEASIASLLGDRSEFEAAMPSLIRITNGATEDRTRRRSLPFLKISRHLRGPKACVSALGTLLQFYGVDFTSCRFTCVERNAITLVPKNWKTHRTIAKEPTHSLPFQLALDTWLKSKLRKWGIDLSSQGKNQEMARIGSLDGSLATLDLEMASDTLSFNAVVWMLPFEWFELFNSFRSSSYSAPWGTGDYAKFSSMGNGYTFTLETLIFTAACKAVGSRQFSVYGDDIILETHLVTPLVKLLAFLGFRVNGEKSFVNPNSRFRESCGCDYYQGQLVTPFYLRECPKESDRPGMSHALNGLVSCVGVPGPLWDLAASEVKRLGLRLVPWNQDSRSGVFITPNKAWKHKVLKVDRRKTRGGKDNPNFGFPIFEGYLPTQDSRMTVGERSLFLWFLEKGFGGERSLPLRSNRTTAYLMQLNGGSVTDEGLTATVKSSVITRTRYVHKTCRFSPRTATTPSHLFLWDDVIGTQLR